MTYYALLYCWVQLANGITISAFKFMMYIDMSLSFLGKVFGHFWYCGNTVLIEKKNEKKWEVFPFPYSLKVWVELKLFLP